MTAEGLFNKQAHPFHRSWVLRGYDAYIRQEVIPFIHHHCQGLPPIAVMGASLGAYHAANTLFKYPDAVKRASGCPASTTCELDGRKPTTTSISTTRSTTCRT